VLNNRNLYKLERQRAVDALKPKSCPHQMVKNVKGLEPMTAEIMRDHVAKLSVETADQLTARDIHELCDAADEAILAGGGFGWLSPPPKSVMEDYWRGVQMIPERYLIIARLDKVIGGSCQIVRPPKNNEAQKFACQLTTFFVAPWARGHGLAQMIVAEA
jgi:hypothetical protein